MLRLSVLVAFALLSLPGVAATVYVRLEGQMRSSFWYDFEQTTLGPGWVPALNAQPNERIRLDFSFDPTDETFIPPMSVNEAIPVSFLGGTHGLPGPTSGMTVDTVEGKSFYLILPVAGGDTVWIGRSLDELLRFSDPPLDLTLDSWEVGYSMLLMGNIARDDYVLGDMTITHFSDAPLAPVPLPGGVLLLLSSLVGLRSLSMFRKRA